MGLQDSAMFGSSFDEPSFEPDDFYESFQAPKFHDFTAPEEPIDPDAFFMAQPGMVIKKAVVMDDLKTMAPKIHKVSVQDVFKTAHGSPQHVPPQIPVVAEKAVRKTNLPRKDYGGWTSGYKGPRTALIHLRSLKRGHRVAITSCMNGTSPGLSSQATFVDQEGSSATRAQISCALHSAVPLEVE